MENSPMLLLIKSNNTVTSTSIENKAWEEEVLIIIEGKSCLSDMMKLSRARDDSVWD